MSYENRYYWLHGSKGQTGERGDTGIKGLPGLAGADGAATKQTPVVWDITPHGTVSVVMRDGRYETDKEVGSGTITGFGTSTNPIAAIHLTLPVNEPPTIENNGIMTTYYGMMSSIGSQTFAETLDCDRISDDGLCAYHFNIGQGTDGTKDLYLQAQFLGGSGSGKFNTLLFSGDQL